ncbi:MAG: hypothetical protein ACI4MO_00550 [Christensenellales bacterium]
MNIIRKKPIIILTVVCAVVLIGAVAFMIGFVNPNLRYADAGSKLLKKDYYNAMLIYQDLGRYKDSETRYRVAELYATSSGMEIEEFVAKALSLGVRVQVAVGEILPVPQEEEEQEYVVRKVWFLIEYQYYTYQDLDDYRQGLPIPTQDGKTFSGWNVESNFYVMHECNNYISTGTLDGDYVFIKLLPQWQ